MRSLSHAAVVSLVAGAVLGSPARAQQFANRNFETGSLSGWTVETTPNGVTNVQAVELFDIDGILFGDTTYAAKFQVGNAVSMPNHQAGIELHQGLTLTAGVLYAVSFNWAANHFGPIGSNAEGGVFALVVDGNPIASGGAGSTAAGCAKYGFVEGTFSVPTTGVHRVGARITRPFLAAGVYQWVDNFDCRPHVTGACCVGDGVCTVVSRDACEARGGVYRGDQTSCVNTDCPIPNSGACCLPNVGCVPTSRNHCRSLGGDYAGDGISCGALVCPAILSTAPSDDSLATTDTGVFMDLTAAAQLSVIRLEFASPADPGNWTTIEVWRYPGSYVGHDGDPSGWILHQSLRVETTGDQATAPLYLNPAIAIAPGQTVGVYVTASGGGVRVRGTPSSPPQTTISDANLTLFSDRVRTGRWGGTLETPRSWAGAVHYNLNSAIPCYANCDGSTTQPVLNVNDFVCFQTKYASGDSYANCDRSTALPVLNINDFICFQMRYAVGCP